MTRKPSATISPHSRQADSRATSKLEASEITRYQTVFSPSSPPSSGSLPFWGGAAGLPAGTVGAAAGPRAVEVGGTGAGLRLAAFVDGLEDWLVLRGIRPAFCGRASAAGGAATVGAAAVPLGTEDLGPVALRDWHKHSCFFLDPL